MQLPNEIIILAQSALDRSGIPARATDIVGESFVWWLACAELAARWTSGHPATFIELKWTPGQIGEINATNLGTFAWEWTWVNRPGEWDCDGYWCPEAEMEEFRRETAILAANTLLEAF